MQCKCSRTSFQLAARCATFVALVTALPAHAQQFVLVDQTYTADADTVKEQDIFMSVKAVGFKAELSPGIPADLRAPTNYANGKIHVELDIMEAASSALARYTICFANSDNYACLPYIDYEGTGKYDAEPGFSALWQYMDKDTDWSKGITTVMMIIKNEAGDEQVAENNNDFYPYKAHVTMTVLAPGATFDPDAGSSSGGAGGSQASGGRGGSSAEPGSSGGKGGSPASASDGGRGGISGGTTATAGRPAAGGNGASAMTGAAGVAGTRPQTPSGAAAGSGGTATSGNVLDNDDSGGEKRSISSQLENTSGCAVSGLGSARASSAWPLLAFGLFALRRRKRQGSISNLPHN